MFLDIISKIFIFVAIHAMIIFIQNLSKKTPTSLSRSGSLSQNALLFLHTQNIY